MAHFLLFQSVIISEVDSTLGVVMREILVYQLSFLPLLRNSILFHFIAFNRRYIHLPMQEMRV